MKKDSWEGSGERESEPQMVNAANSASRQAAGFTAEMMRRLPDRGKVPVKSELLPLHEAVALPL
jgi:hypothetical protein